MSRYGAARRRAVQLRIHAELKTGLLIKAMFASPERRTSPELGVSKVVPSPWQLLAGNERAVER